MKELTFKGFLKSYLAELSCCSSYAPTKLCKEVKSNLRLAEPLVLYIKLSYDENYQKKVNSQIINELLSELSGYEDIEFALMNELLPYKFQRIYDSYIVKKNRKKHENQIKLLIFKKIKQAQKEKNISNYRIYTDLKLNIGNINDFLTNGNINKLSLDTARKILTYVSA